MISLELMLFIVGAITCIILGWTVKEDKGIIYTNVGLLLSILTLGLYFRGL